MLSTRTVRAFALLTAIPLVLSMVPAGAAQVPEDEGPFPGPDEVQDRLDTFAEHEWVTVHEVGTSVEDRPIRVAEVADPNASTPRDERAVTLLLTQQHGNEPAGTPATLRLLENVTSGSSIQDQLDNQILLVLPQANPDGSEAGTRGNTDGVDINRDHIGLETPEARAVHEVLNRWDVHVALDNHEYGGTGPGNPVPVRTYDYDLLTLFPRHGNVQGPTLEAAQDLMYEGIFPAAEEEGYSISEYGVVTADGEEVEQIAGGPDPGILRNHYGLHNVAGLLIESRIDQHPNPFHSAERRIQAHTVTLESTVAYVHDHAQAFQDAKEASAHVAERAPDTYYEETERAGHIEPAYLVEDTEDVRDTVTAHGMDPGTATGDGLVHSTQHGLLGHSAALFHPDSSRAIADASATDPVSNATDEAVDTAGTDASETPLGLGALVAGLAGALALTRRRGRE